MRRSAAGHDHSTQHLTDVRTRRVFASTRRRLRGHRLGLPGQHAARSAHPALGAGFAPTADDDATEAGGGAAAAAGQTVVYHDVTGSFRDAGLHNGRPYYYTVFARHPGREWVRWGEYELRPGVPATSVAGRLPAAFRRRLPPRAAGGAAALPGRPRRDPRLCRPPPSKAEQAADAEAVAAATADPTVAAALPSTGYQTSVTPWSDAQGAPAGATVTFAWPAASARSAAGVWPLLESDDGGVPAPPYATVEHRVRITDLTALQVDVLLQDGRVLQILPLDGETQFRAAGRDLAAVLVVPVAHGPPVGAAAGVPAGRRRRDRARLAAFPRLEPQTAVDDPSRPPVHRQAGGHPLPPRRLRLAGVRGHLRGARAGRRPRRAQRRRPGRLAAPPVPAGALPRRPGHGAHAGSSGHRVAWGLVAFLAAAGSFYNLATAVTGTTTNLNLSYYILLGVLCLLAAPRAFSAARMGWSRNDLPRYA